MFNMNGINWEIVQVSPNYPKLLRTSGTFALAVCDQKTQTIYLSSIIPVEKLQKVLCHEITHAAMFSYQIYMTVDQEELVADLIATYGEEIIAVTNKIFKKIKGRF